MAFDPMEEDRPSGARGGVALGIVVGQAGDAAARDLPAGEAAHCSQVQRGTLDLLPTRRLLELLLGSAAAPGAAEGVGAHDLAELSRWEPGRLELEAGLAAGASEALAAAFALGRRVEEARWLRGDTVRSPGGVFRLMAPRLRGLEREVFSVLLVDGKHRLIAVEQVSEGTLTTSLVHPREVFRPAIRRGAAAVVVVHNHPSGDPEPSGEDIEVTRRLLEAGKLLGIPMLDHVVVGRGTYVSLRERMGL